MRVLAPFLLLAVAASSWQTSHAATQPADMSVGQDVQAWLQSIFNPDSAAKSSASAATPSYGYSGSSKQDACFAMDPSRSCGLSAGATAGTLRYGGWTIYRGPTVATTMR